MSEDHRIVKLEADVEHLCADMSEVKQDIRELQTTVSGLRTDFQDFRLEVAKEMEADRTEMTTRFGEADVRIGSRFAEVDMRIESLRTDMVTRFGAVDVRIEALKTLVERNTRIMMVGGLSVMGTLVAMFGTIGHALKWF